MSQVSQSSAVQIDLFCFWIWRTAASWSPGYINQNMVETLCSDIYEYTVYDSEVEHKFAVRLDTNEGGKAFATTLSEISSQSKNYYWFFRIGGIL